MTSGTAQCQGQMGRRYESIYVSCTDGIAIQCPRPDSLFPETEINNAFMIGGSCQAAERTQCNSGHCFEQGVSNTDPPLSFFLSLSLSLSLTVDNKGEKESSFDAELYSLNKPKKTGRRWLPPALQYFYSRPSFPRSQPCHKERVNAGEPIIELGVLRISDQGWKVEGKIKNKQPQTTKTSIGTSLQAPASNDEFSIHHMY